MEVRDLSKHKAELEKELSYYISVKLKEFSDDAEISVEGIDVRASAIRDYAHALPTSYLVSVRVNVEL